MKTVVVSWMNKIAARRRLSAGLCSSLQSQKDSSLASGECATSLESGFLATQLQLDGNLQGFNGVVSRLVDFPFDRAPHRKYSGLQYGDLPSVEIGRYNRYKLT